MAHEQGRITLLLVSAVASGCMIIRAAEAQPSQIILLRHAEKASFRALSATGQRRAAALAAQYLGKSATQSLFPPGQAPTAFLALTRHSVETITPAAETWALQVTNYLDASGDEDKESDAEKDEQFARGTKEAAQDIRTNPEFNGKIVVVSWEHRHIANRNLKQGATFRQLLGLASLSCVPEKWPDDNYDYFWIVNYAPGNPTPTSFKKVKQMFAKPYDDLPSNDWDDGKEKSPKHEKDDCKH
jgi:hypothetical protein